MSLADYKNGFRKLLKLCTDGYEKEGGAFFLYNVSDLKNKRCGYYYTKELDYAVTDEKLAEAIRDYFDATAIPEMSRPGKHDWCQRVQARLATPCGKINDKVKYQTQR